MRPILLEIDYGYDDSEIPMVEFTKALNKFAVEVIRRARIALAVAKKNSTGNLSNSLASSVKVGNSKITLSFDAPTAPYWEYVNYGVRGKISDAKAPESPFKFGTKTGESGGLRRGIRSWIDNKPIKQWKHGTKEKKGTGRFMSYDEMTNYISRSVYLYGIESSYFYSGALEMTYKKYKKKLAKALRNDYEAWFFTEFNQTFEMKITI